jgi:hypothetical protein
MTSHTEKATSSTLPYTARELSPKEVRDEDIYTFNSPKMGGRRTRVAQLPNLILALQLEFDPEVERFVERPRRLTCDTDTYEFSFWYRLRSGREYLPLLVSTGSTEPAASTRRRHRKERQLLEAAERAQLPLKFEFETDLLQHAAALASWLRMLPGVQLASRFKHRFDLRERILEIARRFDRVRISQIVDVLDGFPAGDVRCVICDLIHAGHLCIDPMSPLTAHAICQVRRA